MEAAASKSKAAVSCTRSVAIGIAEAMFLSDAPEHRPGRDSLAQRAAPDWSSRDFTGVMGDVAVGQVGEQLQRCTIAHPPAGRQQAAVCRVRLAGSRAREPRDDLLPAYRKQLLHQLQPLLARWLAACAPIEHGGLKGRFRQRIRDLIAIFRIGPSVFAGPPLAHGFREVTAEIAEEWERRFGAPFL